MNEQSSPLPIESFVSAEAAADFLAIRRRQLSALTRTGRIPGYPLGTGTKRRVWRYRLSELQEAVTKGLVKPASSALAQTAARATVTPPPDQTTRTPVLRLRHLDNPPEKMPLNQVVHRLHPALKSEVLEARYYVIQEKKENHDPSVKEISEKFPLLADATESEINEHVVGPKKTPHEAAVQIIHNRCSHLDLRTLQRYLRPMGAKKQ